jgi:hypothetical protein
MEGRPTGTANHHRNSSNAREDNKQGPPVYDGRTTASNCCVRCDRSNNKFLIFTPLVVLLLLLLFYVFTIRVSLAMLLFHCPSICVPLKNAFQVKVLEMGQVTM